MSNVVYISIFIPLMQIKGYPRLNLLSVSANFND